MGFANAFPNQILMQTLGDNVTYISNSEKKDIQAVFEKDVERVGDNGYTLEHRSEIEFLKSDLSFYPMQGDYIQVNDETFTVDAVLYDDGFYVRLALKNG